MRSDGYQQISYGGAPLDPESEYYWGIALHYTGDVVSRPPSLGECAERPHLRLRPPNWNWRTSQAAQGHWSEALAGLAPLDALSKRLTRAGELEVIALRHTGEKVKAEQRLQAWLAIDPTNGVLRNEATLLGKDDPSLWLHLAAEPERVLNVVDTYLRVADYAAALSLLERTYPASSSQSDGARRGAAAAASIDCLLPRILQRNAWKARRGRLRSGFPLACPICLPQPFLFT